ncbi:hypothetical protein O1W68_16620 [Rhodococcus sp. H36-A4]|uniref:phage terminase large subunit family protein n=1 Tax=Rhodococcus sp. H36-A4 TaxID=3004353 RepID=UPI0022AF4BC3|nr:hypothetical protein [Rhodococcus sp. H36-A4]MCZ4079574.1 hypothetical protein [Rhodococcus sp. H36-A4]
MSNSVLDQIRKVGEYATTYRSSSEGSEIAELVNDDLLKQTVVNASADTIYYVSLDKGNLTEANSIAGVSMEPGGSRRSFSNPVANTGNNSALGDIGPILSLCLNDESAVNVAILSSSAKLPIVECIDIESLPLQELTTTDSDQLLTKAGEHESEKNDLNSVSLSLGTSIPNSSIANFETLQAQQLERLGSKTNINKGEFDLEQTQIESVSFYDSLDQDLQWVLDEKIHVHYYPAIITNADGTESSWWPEYKPLEELNEIRHTRSFAMNYMNRPVNVDAEYWRESDIQIGECLDGYVRTLISVDPAVSTKQSNDYTALCVVSLGEDGLIYVRHAEQVRYVSVELKDRVNELVDSFDAGLVLVETNQGGMLWSSVFDGVQANYKSIHQTEPKPVRAGRALDYYRKNKVRHTRHFAELEEQMYSYPKVTHDDLLDAMGTGIHYFLSASNRPRVRRRSYI